MRQTHWNRFLRLLPTPRSMCPAPTDRSIPFNTAGTVNAEFAAQRYQIVMHTLTRRMAATQRGSIARMYALHGDLRRCEHSCRPP
jgi:hypothetical protein